MLGLKQMVDYITSAVFHSVSPMALLYSKYRWIIIIMSEEQLKDTFPYLDDITVAGSTLKEHDSYVTAFLKVVSKRNLTLNESKSALSSSTINVLGYLIGNGVVRPDPERLRPLQELPPPTNVRSQRRVLGLCAYYVNMFKTRLDNEWQARKYIEP